MKADGEVSIDLLEIATRPLRPVERDRVDLRVHLQDHVRERHDVVETLLEDAARRRTET